MTGASEHGAELLPWLRPTYERLCKLLEQQRLAHAYLFGGQQGLGKLALARHFAHYLLCTAKEARQPCHECGECRLLAAGTHPDLLMIGLEEKSSEIRIDQIRQAMDFLARTAQRGGYKVILISPAEAMNQNAANALLKDLEEPAGKSLFMLVSQQPALLLPTIRSRCQQVKFTRPEPEEVIPWLESKNVEAAPETLLKIANYAPLRALQLADGDALHDRMVLHKNLEKLLRGEVTIAQAAAECATFPIMDNIEGMMLCACDILACNQGRTNSGSASLHDLDLSSLAAKFQDAAKIKALHGFYQELLAARRAINSSANANPLLLLEGLFFSWANLGAGS